MKKNTKCKEIFTSEPISEDKSIGNMTIRSHLPQEYTAKVDPEAGLLF